MAEIDDILKQLAEEVKKAGGSDRSQVEAAKLKIKSLALDKENHKQLKQFLDKKNFDKLGKQTGLVESQLKELQPVVKESIAAFDQLGENIRDASSATIGIAKAFYKGEGTISSYTENLSGKFGLFGDTIAGTGRLLDTNIEMFRQLSKTGANFGQSIIQLRTAAGNAALPLDDFVQLVGANSQALAALSGSATQGAEFIAGLGNALRTDAVPQLATLGFTVDEINETLLLNLDRQRRFGTLDRNATQFNIDSAIRFGKQLDSLSKLTGIQRDQLRANIESQQSNAKFAAFLQGQTQETTDRLQSFAGVIQDVAPGLNEGFQDLIANAGVPVTEAALSVVQNIPEARNVIQSLINGTISTEQALVQIRDASVKSIDRFRSATVTGQVEFLALQNDVINLGRRLVDVNAVLGETGPATERLTKGLTQFEDASKRMGSATQSLETAFLSMIGNFVGDATSGVNMGLTGLSKAILGMPDYIAAGLYGVSKLLQGGLALLKDTGPTFAAVYAGVRAGIGTGGLGNMYKSGKGSFAGSMGSGLGLGKGGIGSKLLRGGGLLGTGINVLGAGKNLMDDDKSNNAAAIGTLAGTALGAFFGPVGMMLGGMAGGALGGMIGGKQFGGSMTGGVPHLVGEAGPEIVTTKSTSMVTSNTDLAKTFNTQELENKMIAMVTELNAANKTLSDMVNGVNTLVAIENRSMKAVESTARKDRTNVGYVS